MTDKVKQAYERNKFERPTTPADANNELFNRKTQRAKAEDYVVQITNVYRIAQGQKDFIFYHRRIEVPDLAGNPVVKTEFIGRDDIPTFRNTFNTIGEPEAVALSGFKMEYSIPYSPEKVREILTTAEIEREYKKKDGETAVEKINVDVDSSATNFVLIVPGGRKYGNFTADDFINRSYDELVGYAATGTFQEKAVETDVAIENAKRKLESIKNQQKEQKSVKSEAQVTWEKEAAFDEGTRPPLPAETIARPVSATEQQVAEVREDEKQPAKAERARPEVEQIKEEVIFHLSRAEDENQNEDEALAKEQEDIEKQFEEQEAAKNVVERDNKATQSKKVNRKNNVDTNTNNTNSRDE